jgi:hypothetical protein
MPSRDTHIQLTRPTVPAISPGHSASRNYHLHIHYIFFTHPAQLAHQNVSSIPPPGHSSNTKRNTSYTVTSDLETACSTSQLQPG